ncbi:MAG: OB-fold domain-containing protein, partial [Candidatus Binatia bacterium]
MSRPPLPELLFENVPFWTGGMRGELLIARCRACSRWIHPPLPRCPGCLGADVAAEPVSGRATVVTFTVNRHAWFPGEEVPFVLAIVELPEQPGLRLATRLVGIEPDDVRIGLGVAVRFEQVEDVWLPLFEPTGGTDPTQRVPEPRRPTVRPPAKSDRFEHRVVLSGVGRSAIGRRLMVDPLSLAVDACLEAVADAGLTLADIDGLSTYPGSAPMGMSEGGVTAVEEALRLRPPWINGGGDLPGPGG